MELTTGKIKNIYLKYLLASFGAAILPSIYGIVDIIVVGKYYGPEGAAAMAIIAPIWNIVFSLGLLTGIGTSILFSIEKSTIISKESEKRALGYYSLGLLLTGLLALIVWYCILFHDTAILIILGADEVLLPLAKEYLLPVKCFVPAFLFMLYFAAFLRNDNNPALSTKGVVTGGIFNIFGDIFFVFTLDMGIMGAGLATCLGAMISLLVMLTHFRNKKCTLRFIKPTKIIKKTANIIKLGFSTFFIDIAVGILTMLFNIQIMKYLGSNALAIYGIIVNVAIFVQCCAYGIGQASQPILSANFGAGKFDRIKELFRYNLISVAIISLLWTGVTILFPTAFVYAFMKPTAEVLELAPNILRIYALSFLLLPFNVYATYYFQSTMKANIAFLISVVRGLFVSGSLIILLPLLFGANALWFAMPITELIVAIMVISLMRMKTKVKL